MTSNSDDPIKPKQTLSTDDEPPRVDELAALFEESPRADFKPRTDHAYHAYHADHADHAKQAEQTYELSKLFPPEKRPPRPSQLTRRFNNYQNPLSNITADKFPKPPGDIDLKPNKVMVAPIRHGMPQRQINNPNPNKKKPSAVPAPVKPVTQAVNDQNKRKPAAQNNKIKKSEKPKRQRYHQNHSINAFSMVKRAVKKIRKMMKRKNKHQKAVSYHDYVRAAFKDYHGGELKFESSGNVIKSHSSGLFQSSKKGEVKVDQGEKLMLTVSGFEDKYGKSDNLTFAVTMMIKMAEGGTKEFWLDPASHKAIQETPQHKKSLEEKGITINALQPGMDMKQSNQEAPTPTP